MAVGSKKARLIGSAMAWRTSRPKGMHKSPALSRASGTSLEVGQRADTSAAKGRTLRPETVLASSSAAREKIHFSASMRIRARRSEMDFSLRGWPVEASSSSYDA